MALRVKVRGGTNGCTKQPLGEPKKDWTCRECGHGNKGWHARCMKQGCNRPRP